MGNLFGVRRKAPRVTEQDKAILQLKQQRDKISIYQKRTEFELQQNHELAKRLYNEKKIDRALLILRRKKMMEETLKRTDKQLETLEELVRDIEFSQIQVSVVEGLKVGNEALKQLNSLVNVDELEKVLLETEEGAAKQKELSTILETATQRVDEDELLKELEAYKEAKSDLEETATSIAPETELEDEAITPSKEKVTIDNLIDLPSIPTDNILIEADKKERNEAEQDENKLPKPIALDA